MTGVPTNPSLYFSLVIPSSITVKNFYQHRDHNQHHYGSKIPRVGLTRVSFLKASQLNIQVTSSRFRKKCGGHLSPVCPCESTLGWPSFSTGESLYSDVTCYLHFVYFPTYNFGSESYLLQVYKFLLIRSSSWLAN